jgi:hypothetical protein
MTSEAIDALYVIAVRLDEVARLRVVAGHVLSLPDPDDASTTDLDIARKKIANSVSTFSYRTLRRMSALLAEEAENEIALLSGRLASGLCAANMSEHSISERESR